MHLDGNSIAERGQGLFEGAQPAGSAWVDQARCFALVNTERAGKLGDSYLAGAQCAAQRRLQRYRRLRRYQVLPKARQLGEGISSSLTIRASGLRQRLRLVGPVGQCLGQIRKVDEKAALLIRLQPCKKSITIRSQGVLSLSQVPLNEPRLVWHRYHWRRPICSFATAHRIACQRPAGCRKHPERTARPSPGSRQAAARPADQPRQ